MSAALGCGRSVRGLAHSLARRRGFTSASAASAAEIEGMGASVIKTQYHHANSPSPDFVGVPKTVSVIGAPLTWGQPLAGTDRGPKLLRDGGVVENLIKLGWRVNECGDLDFPSPSASDPVPDIEGNLKNCHAVGESLRLIYEAVKGAIDDNTFALTLGGDHSLGAGTLAGVLSARPDTGVIWVDAHADLNNPNISPSGNAHGMPLSMVTKGMYDWAPLPGFEWLKDVPKIDPEQIVFVGLRDIDAQERKLLMDHPFKVFTMHEVDRYGIGAVMDEALEHLKGRPLHLSYDIDACDPEIAPSTGTIVRGGFNFREAHYIAEIVGDTGMLGSLDMVEVNPRLVPNCPMTAELGNALISSVMGSRIL